MSKFITIKEYFTLDSEFIVPYYQRGYKWSLLTNTKRGKTHLELLFDDLIEEFNHSRSNGKILSNHEYFLQGVTVKHKNGYIELVDGQQRTTSLFILLCALKNAGQDLGFYLEGKLKYGVRVLANKTLQGFIQNISEGDENVQDVAALKKAFNVCQQRLKRVEGLPLFTIFLLEHVKLIYIQLNHHQDETKVFSMMNQDKAVMTQTDLIKSNILREASRQLFRDPKEKSNGNGHEWQINQQRSKLAAEWDNWRKWWENEHHLKFTRMISLRGFSSEPQMSALFTVYWKLNEKESSQEENDLSGSNLFEQFKRLIADQDESRIEAIEVFEMLNLIQSTIEEWYDNVKVYNYLGLLFQGCGLIEKEKELIKLFNYYWNNKYSFVGQIKKEYITYVLGDTDIQKFINGILNDNDVYHHQYSNVARQLLRMNVIRINKQNQKFDYSLYLEQSFPIEEIENNKSRSLEHIKPQKYRDDQLSAEEFEELEKLTNTIGNLVLLPKGLNSKLSNKLFDEKKSIVFSDIIASEDCNYGLWLHTIEVFGKHKNWLKKEIEDNKKTFEREFHQFFNSIS